MYLNSDFLYLQIVQIKFVDNSWILIYVSISNHYYFEK